MCLPSQAGQATATWDKLPVYQPGAQGQKIVYTVTEAQPVGYQEPAVGADTCNDADGHAFEVTNTQDTTSLTAVKTWGSDPANIGRDVAGNALSYTVTEGDVPQGYEKKGFDTHALIAKQTVDFSLINANTPGTIAITAAKTWSDQDNNTGFRPATVAYTLQMRHAGGERAVADIAVLPEGVAASQTVGVEQGAAGAASFTLDSLPAYYPGSVGDQVHYRVVEAPVSGYSSRYDASDITGTATDADAHRVVTVTNSLDPVTYSFAKTDDAGTPLAGTTLTMTGTFANADGSTAKETRTVLGGDKSQDLTGNTLIRGASYALEEATATDGYTYAKDATLTVGGDGSLSVNSADAKTSVSDDGHTVTVADSPTAVTVHIDADGAVSVSGEAPASYALDTADDGAYVLTCSDEPFVLKLLKTDLNGTVLPDASFDVTGQFAGGPTGESA